jgi:hypothetical protein
VPPPGKWDSSLFALWDETHLELLQHRNKRLLRLPIHVIQQTLQVMDRGEDDVSYVVSHHFPKTLGTGLSLGFVYKIIGWNMLWPISNKIWNQNKFSLGCKPMLFFVEVLQRNIKILVLSRP